MGSKLHKAYISLMILFIVSVTGLLIIKGYSYYRLNIEERFFHSGYRLYKSSGILGHALGIMGSLFMLIGVTTYMFRKRIRKFSRIGILKHWLEFHIFLCTLGPILVLFHTAFKFGGIVAVSFWCMVAVVLSGVIGRYIYLQIPRSIEGKELSRIELEEKKAEMNLELKEKYHLDNDTLLYLQDVLKERPDRTGGNMIMRFLKKLRFEILIINQIKFNLKNQHLSRRNYKKVLHLIKNEIKLVRKIDRLVSMKTLFQYWHVVHLPFAIVMLLIIIVHVIVVLTFGYKWIF